MNVQTFMSKEGFRLIVASSGKAIGFFMESDTEERTFKLTFEPEMFRVMYDYLKYESFEAWPGLVLKDATSLSSDYTEYYDKDLDNNGYLEIKENYLCIKRPSLESNRMYLFNKAKMQSFLYDFDQIIYKAQG